MRNLPKKGILLILSLALIWRVGCSLEPGTFRQLFARLGANEGFLSKSLHSQLGMDSDKELLPPSLIPEHEEEEVSPLSAWVFSPPIQKTDTLPIKAISIDPKSPSGYVTHGNIYLKNDSTKEINLKSYLDAPLPFTLSGEGPHVLIIHTHGSESYFPEGKDSYTPDDVERTSDKNYNVVRVGREIKEILTAHGISVVHDTNLYDSPSYNGSYTRALEGIRRALTNHPGISVVLDIHRDAMTAKDGVKYKTSAVVNGKQAAQMMLVLSTGESGLSHPNWQENLKLGVKLQGRLSDKYPGLMRPINLRKDRFNMHATKGSLLIEVGTSANALSEALAAVRPLAEELAGILKEVKS
ncbi:MAG: stage II sporulation protein P [Oscillospiraceae bacterium]|nr:stage II sporulation protein P [Oscillospiraceae bacterium]